MAEFNRVIIVGNITREIDVRSTNSGSKVSDFGMALNRKYKNKEGQEGEETVFVDVAAWGRQGEVVADYCQKGSQLMVEGRLKLDQWEKDGQKRSKLSVVAERVVLLGSKRDDAQAPKEHYTASQGAPVKTGDGNADDDNLPF